MGPMGAAVDWRSGMLRAHRRLQSLLLLLYCVPAPVKSATRMSLNYSAMIGASRAISQSLTQSLTRSQMLQP